MAVAVAADPGAKFQVRDVTGRAEHFQRQPGIAPRLGEMHVQPIDRPREKVAQVVGCVAQLAGNVGPHQVDLCGAPECFQGGDHPLADSAALPFRVFRILVADHFVVERTVAFADAGALGLGRMGGEDRLDRHVFEYVQYLLRLQAHRLQVAQRPRPQAADRLRAQRPFTLAPDLRGHPLLDHVQQLESDRVELRQAVGRVADFRLTAGPREIRQQLSLARAFQRVFQAAEQIAQTFVDEVESFEAELFASRVGGWIGHACGYPSTIRTLSGSAFVKALW